MNRGDLLGMLAGFAIVLVGLIAFTAASNPCYPVTERTSFIGDSWTVPSSQPPVEVSATDNPYALGVCDYFMSDTARALGIVGLIALFLIGYLTTMRIGDNKKPWRGVLSVVAAIACFAVLWSAVFGGAAGTA